MAFVDVAQPALARLCQIRNVTVIANPYVKDPDVVALIMSGIRIYNVRRQGDTFEASFHIGMNEHLALADAMPLQAAYAAVGAHIGRVGHLPPTYSPETDAAERRAAAEILAAYSPRVSFPVAA